VGLTDSEFLRLREEIIEPDVSAVDDIITASRQDRTIEAAYKGIDAGLVSSTNRTQMKRIFTDIHGFF